MKLNLNVKERILIPSILPQNTGLISRRLIQDIVEKTRFSAKEIEEFNIQDNKNGLITWNPEKAKELELEYTDQQMQLLRVGCKQLDEKELINNENFEFIERILKETEYLKSLKERI